MSRLLFLIYIWTGLIVLWPIEAFAGEKVFNAVNVKGENYINLADFTRYYGFDQKIKRKDLDITLKSKYKTVQFKINSRECFVNEIRVWLDNTPLEYRNSILIPEMDVTKTFDPILRQWAVPQRKIKTIMIDPGHGGEDHGSPGSRGTQEKKMTLDLANRLEKLLREEGFFTIMTRRRDIYVSLEDRSQLANSSDADIFVSLHFNAVKSEEAKGIETYCLTPAGLSSTGAIHRRFGLGSFSEEPGNHFDAHNTLLAYLVQQKLIKNMIGAEDRGVKWSRFFVIKATERPSILVESGFLSNPAEEKQILDSAYRDKLAAAIAAGIIRYKELMNGFSKKK